MHSIQVLALLPLAIVAPALTNSTASELCYATTIETSVCVPVTAYSTLSVIPTATSSFGNYTFSLFSNFTASATSSSYASEDTETISGDLVITVLQPLPSSTSNFTFASATKSANATYSVSLPLTSSSSSSAGNTSSSAVDPVYRNATSSSVSEFTPVITVSASTSVIFVNSSSTVSEFTTSSDYATSSSSVKTSTASTTSSKPSSSCASNSVASHLSADNTIVTLAYGGFVAQTGPGLQPTDARKNCQLTLALTYPGGWRYTVFKADHRGYARLAAGDSGVIASSKTLVGPTDSNYIVTDQFRIESTVWSPCSYDGAIKINSEVRISPPVSPSPALMTYDSADLKFTQVHYLVWQRC